MDFARRRDIWVWLRSWWHDCGSAQIEQGHESIPLNLGGGGPPAIVTHALEAFGEDMLEQAADELLAGDRVGVWKPALSR